MTQTIKDLWYGNIAPCDRCGAHDRQAYHLLSLMERSREELCEGLTEKQKTILEKYIDCSDKYLCHMLEQAFCEGFSLGSRLTMEAAAGC